MIVPDDEEEEQGAAEKERENQNEEDAEEQQEEEEEKADPNEFKFIPDVVHLHRAQLFNVEEGASGMVHTIDMVAYCQTLKSEERFELIVEDAYFESQQVDIVD